MKFLSLFFAAMLFILCAGCGSNTIQQQSIARVDSMSAIPVNLKIIDFTAIARRFDSLAFDTNLYEPPYWPLIWIDNSNKNFSQPTFGLYTAMGDARQGLNNNKGMFHEALNTMGAVLGATCIGIDKSNQNGKNYVGMLKNYFNKDTKWNIMMNNTCPEVALAGGGYGRDWWYDVYPNLLFYAIADKYPNEVGFDSIQYSIATQFYRADSVLNGNYNHTFFDYGSMQPKENDICKQQDAAAGHAYVLYAAYKKFGDKRFLQGAKSAIEALLKLDKNTTYEILMPFGAYIAARMNAEEGTHYDVKKILGWTFNGDSYCRKGWGVLVGTWNGFDISGTMGNVDDHGGYGFLMNTYDLFWALVPMVKYDPTYARMIAKWALHAANACRYFYPNETPDNHQTIPQFKRLAKGVIAYEGIIQHSSYAQYENLQAPVAQGDGPQWHIKNPAVSQFSVYGSGHIGIIASTIAMTEVPAILQINLNANDYYAANAQPCFLYWNPYTKKKTISIDLGKSKVNMYDKISSTFIAKQVSGNRILTLDGNQVVVICLQPI